MQHKHSGDPKDFITWKCKTHNIREKRQRLTVVLTLSHSERPKLYAILVFLSPIGLSAHRWHKTTFQET